MVSWELTLEPGARSVKAGRDLVRRVLAGLDRGCVETAALLTDELVANAVVHGRPPFVLAVHRGDHAVDVVVTDAGPGLPHIRPVTHLAESGRGLVIVDVLSDQWGVDELPGGKRVWFRIEAGGTARSAGGASR
jgi:anti-sigma regulatory factor (Ser/Thr protein kinase)